MRKEIVLLFIIPWIFGCDSESNDNANPLKEFTSKLTKSITGVSKKSAIEIQYENAKSENTSNAWEKLIEKALDENNEKILELALDGAWHHAKTDAGAMMALALFQINTKEEYERLVRSAHAKEKAEKEKQTEDEAIIRKQTISLGGFIEKGGIKVHPRALSIKTLTYTSPYSISEEQVKTDPLLCLDLVIENISLGEVFAPVSPVTLQVSSYTDNFNNVREYAFVNVFNAPYFEEIGQLQEIKPNESLEACIPFQPPAVDIADEFSMDLYLVTSNKKNYGSQLLRRDRTDAIIIKFDREQIITETEIEALTNE